ncbi:MAG: hypothetical protein AABM30_09895 [Actinomycetota bacterium]
MKDVKEILERVVPEPTREVDWDAVLRDARPSGARRAAPRVAILVAAVAFAALLAVAPWRGAERAGIIDRALAAVGDGPVLHVVLRDNLLPTVTLVDLSTGERKRVSEERELWYDQGRGRIREVLRFGGVVEYEDAYTVGPNNQAPEVTQFSADYRRALEAGTARVDGKDVIEGIPVYWITVLREAMTVFPSRKTYELVKQVAISRETYKPVAIRATHDAWPTCKPVCTTTSQRVLRLETMGHDEVDLARSHEAAGDRLATGDPAYRGPNEIPVERAAEILGRTPFWLGREHADLPLAHALSFFFLIGSERERSGVDFFYGKGADDLSTPQDESTSGQPFVSMTETTDRNFAAHIRNYGSSLRPGSLMGYVPPDGRILVTRGRFGFLVRDGVYIRMEASDGKLLLDAARSLRPMPASSAESGAGG